MGAQSHITMPSDAIIVRAYLREVPELFAGALRAAKTELDPAGIMNPGVLLEPTGAVNFQP